MIATPPETQRTGDLTNRELLRRLWPLFRPRKWHFIGAFGLLMVANGATISGPLLLRHAIDVDIGGRHLAGLHRTVLALLAVQLVQLVASYFTRNWLEWAGQDMLADLRRQMMTHLLKLPMAFYDRTTPGQLLTRVESDTQALRVLFSTTAVMLLGDLLLFAGMFVVMFVESWPLALVTCTILPVMAAITIVFQRRVHPIFVEVRRQGAEVAGRLAEFIQAMPLVQSFARERWAVADFQQLNRRKYQTNLRGDAQVVLWFNLLSAMQNVAFALILGVGGYWALTTGGNGGTKLVTLGILAMFLDYVRRFFQPLMRLSEQVTTIQRALAASERIFVLLAEPLVVADPPQPAAWPGLGTQIEFQNVWFRYQPPTRPDAADAPQDDPTSPNAGGPSRYDGADVDRGELAGAEGYGDSLRDVEVSGSPQRTSAGQGSASASSNDGWILKDVSFTVPAGQSCALVGPTGSGKTTIINLLLRFYDPQQGRILVDGVDIRELRATDLRRNVGMVPQDIYLFPGDLADNLSLGRGISDEELAATARATQAAEFIDRLPGGLHAKLYERGANLSVGQRQLLSFTRALARPPQLLILDEATSAVDPATEAMLGEATERLLAGRTAVVIAHRLSTVRHCQQILVLEQGQIIERGTHADLATAGGLYQSLSRLQRTKHGNTKHGNTKHGNTKHGNTEDGDVR